MELWKGIKCYANIQKKNRPISLTYTCVQMMGKIIIKKLISFPLVSNVIPKS